MQAERIALKTVEAAGDAEVKKLSEFLNVSMTRRVIQPSWWKLCQMMDTDKTGMVPFDRFLRLLRKVLLVPEDRWPEQTLRAVFKAMDEDDSLSIDYEEFMSIFSDKEVKHAKAKEARKSKKIHKTQQPPQKKKTPQTSEL